MNIKYEKTIFIIILSNVDENDEKDADHHVSDVSIDIFHHIFILILNLWFL